MTQTIKIELTKTGVAEITFARPEVHNALNAQMLDELNTLLQELKEEEHVRMLCLQGAGKSFCAGADLSWMQQTIDFDMKENFNDAFKLSRLMETLYGFPKPTVAVVHGSVYGGGVGLVACCDIAIAHKNTQFCLAETKLGLVPATIAPYLIEAIGTRALRYLTLSAQVIYAQYAHELGLVQEVLDDVEDLQLRKKQLLEQIINNGPQALKTAKQLITSLHNRNLDSNLQLELAELIASLRIGEEAQERMLKFLRKS